MQPNKYIIDGDADGTMESNFFSQLKNMFSHPQEDNANNNTKLDNEDGCCLLTKEPLKDIHMVLACGHKFNYIPLYREVVAQKTVTLSSGGYYGSHSLKGNEIKCPYCRNVQNKLLPYLEYDGIKKLFYVNHPAKMSMTTQPCTYSVISTSKSKKSKKSPSCKDSAIEFCNGVYLCKKHYELSISLSTESENSIISSLETINNDLQCGVILRYGKNKGKPCTNPPSCRVHMHNTHPT
jgi:hypothetical protein